MMGIIGIERSVLWWGSFELQGIFHKQDNDIERCITWWGT